MLNNIFEIDPVSIIFEYLHPYELMQCCLACRILKNVISKLVPRLMQIMRVRHPVLIFIKIKSENTILDLIIMTQIANGFHNVQLRLAGGCIVYEWPFQQLYLESSDGILPTKNILSLRIREISPGLFLFITDDGIVSCVNSRSNEIVISGISRIGKIEERAWILEDERGYIPNGFSLKNFTSGLFWARKGENNFGLGDYSDRCIFNFENYLNTDMKYKHHKLPKFILNCYKKEAVLLCTDSKNERRIVIDRHTVFSTYQIRGGLHPFIGVTANHGCCNRKYYFECRIVGTSTAAYRIGWSPIEKNPRGGASYGSVGETKGSYAYSSNGSMAESHMPSSLMFFGEKYSVGDTIGSLLDWDSKMISFIKNGRCSHSMSF